MHVSSLQRDELKWCFFRTLMTAVFTLQNEVVLSRRWWQGVFYLDQRSHCWHETWTLALPDDGELWRRYVEHLKSDFRGERTLLRILTILEKIGTSPMGNVLLPILLSFLFLIMLMLPMQTFPIIIISNLHQPIQYIITLERLHHNLTDWMCITLTWWSIISVGRVVYWWCINVFIILFCVTLFYAVY